MRTIGVISPFISGVFLGEVFAEILKAAAERGVRIVALRTGEERKAYVSPLSLELCDGWISIVGAIGADLVVSLARSGRPVVSIAQVLGPGASSVHSDNREGVRQAMEHWLARGHRSFACLGYRKESDIGERMAAFQDWLASQGLDASDSRVVEAPDYSLAGGWEAAQTLDARGVPFTALFCGHDQTAAGALQYYRNKGGPIPEMIGYDNSTLARDPDFDLSSLDQDFAALAREALTEILARVEAPETPPRHILVPPRLVLRRSTGHPSARPESVIDHESALLSSMLSSDEMNRFLHGGRTREEIRPLLLRLAQHAQGSLFADLKQDGYQVSVAVPEGLADSGTLGQFGRSLLGRGDSTVVVLPIEASGRVESALAFAFPAARLTHPLTLALVTHQLELVAFAIERSTLKDHLERQVEERTRQLEQAQADLIQAARVSVVGPLVNAVAHHLNTPLGNGILAYGHLRPQIADPEARATLDLIGRSLDRASLLVQKFRQLVDAQSAEPGGRFEAGAVVRAAALGALSDGAELALKIDAQPLWLEGPSDALFQVVQALVANAVVHGRRGAAPAQVAVTLTPGETATLEVSDQGPGLEPALAARVFEPFFTTRLADQCGLGLTLVHNVVTTLFGGSVEITTAPDRGFFIRCRFPLSSPRS